jgi:hypothetical protein
VGVVGVAVVEVGVVTGAGVEAEAEDGVVVIAEAGKTIKQSHRLQPPMMNKQGRRGNELSSLTAHRILGCGDRLSLLFKARKRSGQMGTMRHRSNICAGIAQRCHECTEVVISMYLYDCMDCT